MAKFRVSVFQTVVEHNSLVVEAETDEEAEAMVAELCENLDTSLEFEGNWDFAYTHESPRPGMAVRVEEVEA